MQETNVWCDAEEQAKHPAKWAIIVRGKEGNNIHTLARFDACPHHLGAVVSNATEQRTKLVTDYRAKEMSRGSKSVEFYGIDVRPLEGLTTVTLGS